MTNTAVALFSICSYIGSTLLIARHLSNTNLQRVIPVLGWLGAGSHLLFTGIACQQNQGFNFSFASTASLISMIVAVLLLLATLTKPVEKLAIVVFPVAAAMLALELLAPAQQHSLQTHNWEMSTHILTSIIAFSLLNIAALQAILLAFQDQQLKSHPPKPFVLSLPPLQTMESLLFQMLSAGVLFLTISLITGFLFIEDLFTQHLVHKTVLSILAWLIFSGLLVGRWLYGWRGRTATKLTLAGFILLILAYFGSKFVLEMILNKA